MTLNEIRARYIPENFARQEKGNTLLVEVPNSEIVKLLTSLYREAKLPLKTVVAAHKPDTTHEFSVSYVFGIPGEGTFIVPYVLLNKGDTFHSMAPLIHEFSGYECEIKTMFGLHPTGHPNPRSTVIHANWPKDKFPLRREERFDDRPAMIDDFSYPFFEVGGEGMYQIPVGPVHAGIIEPGHFVFSVLGEEIEHLDAQLGYVHKGVEKLFENIPEAKHLTLAERISGDSSFAHALAYAQAIEAATNTTVPDRALYLRVIYAELERIANHFNDIGFIMLDTAFSFGGANGARLRERIMQWNEKLSGSRFLRNVVQIGGVSRDISKTDIKELIEDLKHIEKDFREVMTVALESATMANRLNNTGRLPLLVALDYGVVGVPLRALGIARDARKDYPYAAYKKLDVHVATETTGDVAARFMVRVSEVYASLSLLQNAITTIPEGKIHAEGKKLPANTFSVGVVEGWRGDIVYVIKTDSEGKIDRVKVRDTSFLNWQAFPHVVLGEMVPDFPLCNKSFNLSYTGNDL